MKTSEGIVLRSRPALKADAGFGLIETIISVLLIALAAATIGSAVLSIRVTETLSTKKEQASAASETLREALRNFVIADRTGDPTPGDLAALGAAMTGYLGCTANCQKLPGDTCSWALAAGCVHNANVLLPADFQAAPFLGTMSYTVTSQTDGRQLQISVNWTEPKI